MGCFGVVSSLLLLKMSQGVRGARELQGLASRLQGGSIEAGKGTAEMAAIAHFICRVLFEPLPGRITVNIVVRGGLAI